MVYSNIPTINGTQYEGDFKLMIVKTPKTNMRVAITSVIRFEPSFLICGIVENVSNFGVGSSAALK